MDTRIGKNPKDHRADAKTTAPFLAHSKNLEELRETLVFFTEHSKNPAKCNLTSFRDGYSTPDDPLYHSGRPALISELFYAIYDQVVYNAASSIVTLRWSLHNWWRVMDHVERELPSHPKVSSVADLTEIHWQVALQLNIPGKAYYAFLKAVNVTRRALGKTEFTWRGPDPDSSRMDRSTGKKIVPPLWQGDLIRHELKHRWFHTLRKFEYFDALRLARMPLVQKEDAPAIRRQERKILRWISDYEEWNPSLPPVKRDCKLRESATAYRQNIRDLAIDSKGIYQGFFPNQDDVKNAFHLCLANYGLNVATLLSIDVSQDMLVPHPKDSNRFVFTGIKDRADGEPQYVEGLFKSQGGLGFILTFLIERTAPLRTELFNRLRNCKEEYARLLKYTRAEDTDLPDSWFLAVNLLSNLDVEDPEQAREALNILPILKRNALLTKADVLQEIHANLTLEFWEDANVAAHQALIRFQKDPQLLSLQAVALEMQGHTGAALVRLESALAAGQNRVSTLHNYMGIALRLGHSEKAARAINQLLQLSLSREERMELLRLLAMLRRKSGEFSAALSLVEAVARLVNREDEDESGMLVNLIMSILLGGPPIADESRKRVLQEIVEEFCNKWPESRHFRRLQIDETANGGRSDIYELMDMVLGDSRQRMQEFVQRERQLKDGEIGIPYVMRPGYALHYVGNVFDLWEIAKTSRSTERQFHVPLELGGPDLERKKISGDVPLLDITALLLLDSLGLFDKLFSLFESIAIPRATVGYISQHANGILSDGAGQKLATSILEAINKWISRIQQPSFEQKEKGVIQPDYLVREYAELAQSGKWLVYCDDAVLRGALKNEGCTAIGYSTADLLRLIDVEEGAPSSVARLFVAIVRWHVITRIDNRYLLATLDGMIQRGRHPDASKILGMLEQNDDFRALLRAVVRPDKDTGLLMSYMSKLLIDMLRHEESNAETAAAVFAFWFSRVRLFHKAGGYGWDLLALPTMHALLVLPLASSSRVISVLRSAVELCVPDESQIDQTVNSVVTLLGTIAGQYVKSNVRLSDQIFYRLTLGMPAGTNHGDLCIAAYKDAHHKASEEQ